MRNRGVGRSLQAGGLVAGLLALTAQTAKTQAEPGAGGAAVVALYLGPQPSLGQARLTGWQDGAPILEPAPGASLPPGRPVWLAAGLGTPEEPGPALATLTAGGELAGRIAGGDEEGEWLRLAGPAWGEVSLPLGSLKVVRNRALTAGWETAELAARARPGEELLLLPAGNPPVRGFDSLAGFLFRFGPEAVLFAPGEEREPRTYPFAQVGAFVRAPEAGSAPAVPGPERALLRDGSWLELEVKGWSGERLAVRFPWGGEGRLDPGRLAGLDLPGPHLFLSRLAPRVAEEPWLGPGRPVLFPWRADRACTGGPLQADGRLWSRGFGVHARCRLAFALDGGWESFATFVAIDDSARSLPVAGNADVRILLDGRELWACKGLRGGLAPVPSGPLPVAGGKELVLEADFGEELHLGDRVDWLLPVLWR